MHLKNNVLLIFLTLLFSVVNLWADEPESLDSNLPTQNKYSSLLLLKHNFSEYPYSISDDDSKSLHNSSDEGYNKKSPWLAFGLSMMIPGLGQIYNGDYTKAIIQAGMVLVGGGLFITTGCVECGEYGTAQTAIFFTGLGMAFSGYHWSMIDAPTSANEINSRIHQNTGLPIYKTKDGMISLRINKIPRTKSYTLSLGVNF